MENNNIVFVQDLVNKSNMTNEFKKLLMFTETDNDKQRKKYRPIIKKEIDSYVYFHNGKKYPFTLFSDDNTKPILSYDIKILKSNKREFEYLFRTLKYACNLDIVNPKVVVGTSKADYLEIFITYQENNIEKIIDYSKNIKMTKNDYYDLFKIKEINVLDKNDLYFINNFILEFNAHRNVLEFLFFYKEIYKELTSNSLFKFINKKYDHEGVNYRNYPILGNNCDYMFFQKVDSDNKNNNNLIEILDTFTENPNVNSRYIEYDEDKKSYSFIFNSKPIFRFRLLSDYVISEEIKENLLSSSRYHECHENSILVASSLDRDIQESTYIVGGKIDANKQNSFLHSWVEIDKDNLVLDYNHNIIMNRDSYYKLFYASPISKTNYFDYYKYFETIMLDFNFNFHPTFLNYFGKEISKDLEKNKQLIKK